MPSQSVPVVLLAFANVDPKRPLRNLPGEEEAILGALQPLVASRRLETVVLRDATANDVLKALRRPELRGRVRVFHFGGHADDSALMLANEDGSPGVGHADGLADYLGEQEGLELVVLNGCSTKAQVDRLRNVGITAVVATSRGIRDDVAAELAGELYAELVSKAIGEAFDAAVSAVRIKKGSGPLREMDLDELEDDVGDETSPWELFCARRHRRWRLVEAVEVQELGGGQASGGAGEQGIGDEEAITNRLAEVLYDRDQAVMVVARAGVPRGMIPAFTMPAVFWHKVVEMLLEGASEDGLPRLLAVVAKMYPGNAFFRRYRRG